MQSRFTMRTVVALLVAVTLLCATGFAQRIDGALRGTITDASGAVVAGATVTATNVATGTSFSSKTNDTGFFNFNNLLPGTYKLRIEAATFSAYERQVLVSTNQVNDIKIQMTAQAAGETVEVTDTASLVQSESSQLTNTFDSNVAINIPVANGGDVRNLAIYAPGVTAQSGGTAGQGGSVGGLRARSNSFNIDGLDDNDVSTTGGTSGVIQDAVQEFTILTNNFSAEYGNAGGGVFNIVSKSGTNRWHGSGFIYFQDERLNALDNLESAQADSDPLFEQPNIDFIRPGFTIGGPIKKDKIFIFGAYEYSRLSGVATGSEETPTAAGLAALTGIAQNATIADMLSAFPTASTPTRTQLVTNLNTLATANVEIGEKFIVVPDPTKTKQYMVNGDININQAQQLRLRYNLFQSRGTDIGSDERFSGASNYDAHKASLNHVWSMTSNWVNDLRVGYSRSIGPSLEGAVDPADNRFPNITLFDLADFFLGPAGNSPQTGFQNVYQLHDQMNVVKGNHSLRFGAEGRSYIATSSFLQRQRGDYFYSGLDQFISDWAPDIAGGALRGVGRPDFDGNTSYFGAYFQDDWKITRNLTLNLGIRYDYFTTPADTRLQGFNEIASLPGTELVFNVPRADKDNFGPRLGFAWDPTGSGKWSVRGGYAINYDVIFQNLPLLQLPAQVQGLYDLGLGCGISAPPAWCADPNGANFHGTGAILNVLAPITDQPTARAFTTNKMIDETHPMIQSWSLGVQRELWKDSMFEVRYTGTKGSDMPVQRILNATSMFERGFGGLPTYLSAGEIPATVSLTAANRAQAAALAITGAQFFNRPFSADGFFGGVTEFSPIGESHYHGLSFDFTQRMWRGLTLRTNYTWSKSIDNSTNELNTSTVNPRRPQDFSNTDGDRGLSVFHIPHKFAAVWTYQVPGLKTNGFIERLTGGWELNGGVLAQSGQYVTVQSGIDANGNGDTAGDRAVFNPAGSGFTISTTSFVCRNAGTGATSVSATTAGCGGNANIVGYVANDPTAQFVLAQLGTIANTGRNNIQSPGLQNWNMAIGKKTKITEGTTFEVRADMFNIFNHRNYTFGNTGVFNLNTAATGNGNYVRGATVAFGDHKRLNGGNRTITLVAKFIF
jgi:outer membrane receptor protein involved in Fe transport